VGNERDVEGYLVITNPGAGSSEQAEEALAALRGHGEVDVRETDGPASLSAALDATARRVVVAAGGDGTLHAVLAALHRGGLLGEVTVGLLPLGTGNDFARCLGLPLSPAAAARVVGAGHTRPMDLVVDDEGRVVVNNVHLGAGAEAARRASGWKERLGRPGYLVGALLAAVRPPVLRLRVEVDGAVVCTGDSGVLQVAIGNGASVGGGTELVPDAEPGDGLLDVVISTPRSRLAFVGYARDLIRGRHHHRADVTCVRGRSVTVSGEEFWCSADGETSGPVRRRRWRVAPAAYRMIVP